MCRCITLRRFVIADPHQFLKSTAFSPTSSAQHCLAKSWEISDDGLTYTVHLVEDAVFHNGEKLTAKDVAFTYEWAKQFPGRQLYYKSVVSTEVVDDYTIIFTLDSPQPLFMTYSQSVPIMNEKFVTEKGEEGVAKEVCGTGPYTITSYDPAVAVKLTAFPDYRLGEAAIKNAEIRYYSDKSTAQIAMNTTVEPFDNKLVRQAFAYAIDRQSVIDIAYDGLGTMADFMCYTNSFGVGYSDATQYTYNPEKAKELLAEAG
ncbi:MAG: ABC transporter substrate-binding protein [Ruminococcaceae bacterium]|nr:ABC transporter substrate-binding protein [Oscillospiraceae bacterium]